MTIHLAEAIVLGGRGEDERVVSIAADAVVGTSSSVHRCM
jgi:hypothetical protein